MYTHIGHKNRHCYLCFFMSFQGYYFRIILCRTVRKNTAKPWSFLKTTLSCKKIAVR